MNSYSKCEERIIDPNSKYQFIDSTLDTLISIQRNELEIQKSDGSSLVNILYVYKKSIIDYECSLQVINNFQESKKTKIKESIASVVDYLISSIKLKREVLSIINNSNIDMSRLDDRVSDLKIQKDEIDRKLIRVSISLITGSRFEESDNPKFDFFKVPNDKRLYYLGITTDERSKILKKMNDIFSKDDSNKNILILLIVPTEFLSFSNKNLISLENIN